MSEIWSYIRKCVSVPFLDAWDSANNVAGSVLGAFFAVIAPIHFIPGTGDLIEAGNVAISLAVYMIVAWIFLLVLRMIFVSPFKAYRGELQRAKSLNMQLQDVFNEYIYALDLSEILYINSPTVAGVIIYNINLKLQNSINRPLKYTVSKFIIDGRVPANFINNTVGVSPNSLSTFYSGRYPLSLILSK